MPDPTHGPWTITVCEGCNGLVSTAGHAGRCVPATEREVEVVEARKPIRGRWTIWACPHCSRQAAGIVPRYCGGGWDDEHPVVEVKPVEVVPVPDEQAIERAARNLEAEVKRRNEHYGLDNWDFDEVVRFVLTAALEQPE